MLTCETCKFRFFRNRVIPWSRNRDVRLVCSLGKKNANRGYALTITRFNPATLLTEFLPACDFFQQARHLTKYAPDVAEATSAEPDSGLESVPAVESDTQPRGQYSR